jgi:hypothetical protein
MKAKLEFNLDNEDDQLEYIRCIKARDMALAIWDIEQLLRKWMKEDSEDILLVGDATDAISLIIESYNINLDELIH